MSTSEAAKILGVSERRIRAMLKAKVLKGRKTGRDWSIYEQSVTEALKRDRMPGRPPKSGE